MYGPHPADRNSLVGRGSFPGLALLTKLGLLPSGRSWPCTDNRSHALFTPHGLTEGPLGDRVIERLRMDPFHAARYE
jgi:hypothetical protein